MSNLMHGNTHLVPEDVVRKIPEPQFTKTWHPTSHGKVIDALQVACEDKGIAVIDRQYSLNANGKRMFGIWNLDLGHSGSEMRYAMGFRNGIDRSMAVGICAGTTVMVCDNMCLSGDFIAFRKHTGGLDMELLIEIATEAVGGAVASIEKFARWHRSLHDIYVPQPDLKQMIYDFMVQGAFSPDQFKRYHECLDEERAIPKFGVLDGTTSLYTVHGGATRLMRGWNLLRLADSTRALNKVCDTYMVAKQYKTVNGVVR